MRMSSEKRQVAHLVGCSAAQMICLGDRCLHNLSFLHGTTAEVPCPRLYLPLRQRGMAERWYKPHNIHVAR